jgi:xanthine dehydrogenase accessory factor
MDAVATVPGRASHDPIEAARAWLDEEPCVALATVVSTWGSAPVPVGGQLVVAPDERFEGSVSGGCVEAEVITAAASVIAAGRPRLLTFGVADETAWRTGLPCGGRIEVYVEALDRNSGAPYLDAVLAARHARSPLVVSTDLTSGVREIFDERTAPAGEIADCLRSGKSEAVETPAGRAFLHALLPAPHLVIVGATQIGQILSDLARRLGWHVTLVDPRAAFSSEDRFGDVARLTEWPAPSLGTLGLDRRTAVVALTHVGAIDDEALIAALRSSCAYVGALGSKRTHAARLERLRKAAIGDATLARIRAPIGLPIGAEGPAEIAVAILAEIVKELKGA